MDNLIQVFLWYFVIMNIVTFVVYGVDKNRAIKNKRRIPEKTLLLLAGIGGAFGALIGMRLFVHKIRKDRFKILVPLFCFVWCVVLALINRYMSGNWAFVKKAFDDVMKS